MGKRDIKHKAVYIKMDASSWNDEIEKIEQVCDDMQEEGWTLLTMAFASDKSAVLMFTRPKKRLTQEGDGPSESEE